MATINSLPEEVLRAIFAQLDQKNLTQCQKVCRLWYLPAHISLLSSLEFSYMTDFDRFVRSMDYNPDTSYVNAVQKITIRQNAWMECLFNRMVYGKLITGFPNLKELCINDDKLCIALLCDFEMCEALVMSCTKLQKMELSILPFMKDSYYDLVYQLRHSLVTLELMKDIEVAQCESMETFLISFPRLKKIVNNEGHLTNFEKCLPLIENLPELNNITFGPGEKDDHNFVEKYFASKTRYEQQLMIKRLSEISHITIINNKRFSVDTIKAISQYLTGLRFFKLSVTPTETWNFTEVETFCTDIMNLACSVRHSEIKLEKITLLIFLICFKPVVEAVLYSSRMRDCEYSRHLELYIDNHDSQMWEHPLNLETEMSINSKNTLIRTLRLFIFNSIAAEPLSNAFKSASPLYGIKSFTFSFSHRYYSVETTTAYRQMISRILDGISFLEQVILDIPTIFFIGHKYEEDVRTHVENLILRVSSCYVSRSGLKSILTMFKTVKCLRTFYFCGLWDEDLFEFQFILRGCSLEKLSIDLTPAKIKNPEAFIVINFYQYNSNTRAFFKTTADLSYITDVAYADLEGLKCGQDYTLVHIVVDSLTKEFQCFMYLKNVIGSSNYYDKWGTEEIKVITSTGMTVQ